MPPMSVFNVVRGVLVLVKAVLFKWMNGSIVVFLSSAIRVQCASKTPTWEAGSSPDRTHMVEIISIKYSLRYPV